ncbi:hypothetical protein F4781DRAFT_256658 [Annulohypoxylon bovei var. microspora]|nr:hypothetical protein F4781DRAFT_256658 [Annulohypoxylon bovei var. microspora]
MSPPDCDSSDCDLSVVELIEELTELIHEQVREEPNVDENDEGDDHDNDKYNNGSPDIPRLINNMLILTNYNEDAAGCNYNILKEKYDDQLKIINAYGESIKENVKMIRSLKKRTTSRIRELEKDCKRLEDRLKGISEPPEPWSHMLRVFLRGEEDNYAKVYRSSCKQENMSQKLTVFHPDFNLQAEKIPEDRLLLRRRRAQGKHDRAPHDYLFNRRFLSIVLPYVVTSLQPVSHRLLGQPRFPFERLPVEIQVKIFSRVFVKCHLIHCLSRLDPENPPLPEDFPEEDVDGESQLPTGFHFGTSPCQIALAHRPNDVLGPLLVCKRWFFIGVHAFYGANTFAFSSLGEWHRFCNGIGKERVQRLANVELMWHGSLMRRHETRISRRSLGLSWLTKTRRLRTLVVHIQESAEDRTRRKYERPELEDAEHSDQDKGDEDTCRPSDVPFNPVSMLFEETTDQPNRRNLRSMRTVQGVDYIYQLRGMKSIRFKEYKGPEHRQPILDTSFIDDLEKVVTLPKRPDLALKSKLQNLTALTGLKDWIPSEKDMTIIETFYDESPNVDWVYDSEASDDEVFSFSEVDSEEEEDVESNHSGHSNPDRDYSSNTELLSDAEDAMPHKTAAIPIIPVNHPQQFREHGQEHDDAASERENADDDRSSGLFVSSRSGSAIDPLDRMDVDKDHSFGDAEIDALGENLDDNLFIVSGSGSGSASAGSSHQNAIDLTEEDDDTDGLFVRSRSSSIRIKNEDSDDQAQNQIIDLTMLEDSDDDGQDNSWDYESDNDRFVKEETPPSGEEDDEDEDDEPPDENLSSSNRIPSPSSKRLSEDRHSGDDEEPQPKRRRLLCVDAAQNIKSLK